MAFVVATLQAELYTAFEAMNNISENGNEYMAEKVAEAISDYIKAGTVTSIDAGKASDGGVYAGAGSGAMEIDSSELKSKLKTTFEAEYNNDDLASHIASDIDAVCSASNTCSTDTTGTSTLPGTSPHPASGKGKGTFSGSSSTIESLLKACFSAMVDMSEGGNMYLATQWATAVNSYLTAGSISITLQTPMSGAGSGGIQ